MRHYKHVSQKATKWATSPWVSSATTKRRKPKSLTAAGWDIYEVKSSTYKGDEHDTPKGLLVYSRDVAYQKWLLTQCGVKVNGCYLVRLNKFYTRGKDLDIQQLFHIKNMDEMVENEYAKVQANVSLAQKTLVGDEPNEPVAEHCQKPYCCSFFDYCTKGIQDVINKINNEWFLPAIQRPYVWRLMKRMP